MAPRGQVNIPLGRFVESGVARAGDDSNHPFPVVRILRRAIDADSLSNGAGARPQARGDKIIHDRRVIRVGHLLFAEPAAFQEMDAHGLEILAATMSISTSDLCSFRGTHVSAVILAAKRQRVHGSGAFDSGKRAHRIQNSLVEQRSLCGVGVSLASGQHDRGQNAIRLKARIGADQFTKLLSSSPPITTRTTETATSAATSEERVRSCLPDAAPRAPRSTE